MTGLIWSIGIESHYSYQSSSIGLAGTGYVNAATGSLSLVNPLLATTDHLLPYTVSIIYNSDFAGKDYKYPNAQTAYSSSYMPYGFKLNINETIIEKRFTNSSAGQSTYYVWADSDGTEHVFLPIDDSTTKYQDEDGLQLTLEISSSTCTIKNDSDTIKTFSRMPFTPSSDVYSAWYLTSITDKNNNTLSFTFDNLRPTSVNLTPNGSEPISFLTLSYNTDGHLSVIQNHTSKEAILLRYSSTYGGSIVTSETKYLKEIVFCRDNLENGKATYTYNSAGLLTRVDDMSLGYRVDYTYSNKKVISIQEYGSSPIQTNTLTYSPGQKIEYTYGVYNTIIQTSGADDTYGTSDDLLTTYCFDTLGRTVNCYTSLTRKHITTTCFLDNCCYTYCYVHLLSFSKKSAILLFSKMTDDLYI